MNIGAEKGASSYTIIPGLAEIAHKYDVYLLDIWGLLHDGYHPFPGVLDCLERLKSLGKKTLLLSNSPRRSELVKAQLQEIGISNNLYDHILTSGEATYLDLKDQVEHMGRRCYFLGHDKHRGLLGDISLIEEQDIHKADFILNTGPDTLEDSALDTFKDIFLAAVEQDLLMICANPDMKVILGNNAVLTAGSLAQEYEKLGGHVHYHGKPHAFVYKKAKEILDVTDTTQILALGDSLETDIKGAQNMSIQGALVMSGLHGHELGMGFGEIPTVRDIDRITLIHRVVADYYLPSLRW